MTTLHSKVYIVNAEKDRVTEITQPCTKCSSCLEVNCGQCLACREMKSNPGIFNAVCYKRECSGEKSDKPVGNRPDNSVEKLLQSPKDGDFLEEQKIKERKRKLERSTSTTETLIMRRKSSLSLTNKYSQSSYDESQGKSLKVSEEILRLVRIFLSVRVSVATNVSSL